MNAHEVIDSLMQCAAGQIVACNILAGVEHRLIDGAWVKQTLAWMGRIGSQVDYAGPQNALDALEDLRRGRVAPSVVSQNGLPEVRLRDDGTASPFTVPVSCVVPLHVLGKVVSAKDQGRLAREGLAMPTSATDFISNATIEEWRNRPASVRTVRLNPAESIGHGRSVVWFTRRDALQKVIDAGSEDDRAQRVRDRLGLVHHDVGRTLAALHFPPATLAKCISARPTFADASSHARFKTWPDKAAARRHRSWGTTVDLQALEAGARSIDGCPERVTKEINGSLLGKGQFEFEILGSVQSSPGTSSEASAAFLARLKEGRTVAQIATSLKAL